MFCQVKMASAGGRFSSRHDGNQLQTKGPYACEARERAHKAEKVISLAQQDVTQLSQPARTPERKLTFASRFSYLAMISLGFL